MVSHNSLVQSDNVFGVPSIRVILIFYSVSNCFDVPLRSLALISKWGLSQWMPQKETARVSGKVPLCNPRITP